MFELLKKIAAAEDEEQKPEEESEEPESEEATETPVEEAAEPAPNGSVDPYAIMDFFADPSPVTDSNFHAFCEQNGFDVHQAEAVAYKLAQKYIECIRGGKGYNFDLNTVDPQQIEIGMKIEAEHSADPIMQKKVLADHLSENPEYYSNEMFQSELQSEQGQGQPPVEKQAAMCKRNSKLKAAVMTKTAKKSLAPFLATLMKQLKKQSPTIAKKNIANVTRALKNPKAPIGK